ncbi:MAG: DUF2784 family protein [bacterium]
MLTFLDILLHLAHLILIAFNLFGWLHPKTRRANLICLLLTAGSWFLLGLYYGIGYCPLTDWQWQIKLQMGETNLPHSYIKYITDRLTDFDFDPLIIDIATGAAFFGALTASIYVNIQKRTEIHIER